MSDLIERLRAPWFTNGCEALQLEAAREIAALTARLEAAEEALRPFADFASGRAFDRLPLDFPMTQGSHLARKQVTAADFLRARAALSPPATETKE